jgi:hypothetical protein
MDSEEPTVFTTQAPQVLEPGMRLRVGTVVECVGSGSIGHVYRVLDELGSPVAVREYFPAALAMRTEGLVFPQPQRDAGFEAGRKRFEEDGRQMAALDHPGLLKVQQVWSECGTSYQAMPWCEGRSLDEVLRTASTPPSQRQLSDWLRAMADALAPVHRQLGLHGHLSPSQVMLLDSGRLLVMEISRTGRFLARDPRAIERDPFAALECGSDARYGPMGPWTDIYALAAIAHFAIRGRPPQTPVRRLAYDAQEPLLQDIDGDYDDAFLHGIDCGLALRPRSRPRELAAFMARAGLHERRSRPRASGESLLVNLHLADPTGWPVDPVATQPVEVPQAAAVTEAVSPHPVVPNLDIGIDPEREPAAEAGAEVAVPDASPATDPGVPFDDADGEPWPSSTRPVQGALSGRHSRPIHAIPRVPERRRSGAGRVLAWVVGTGTVTALVALAVMPADPLGELVLPASTAMPATPAPAAAVAYPGPVPSDVSASAAEAATAALSAASAASSPIPEPLEPTAAGPVLPQAADPGATAPRAEEAPPAATEASAAPRAMPESVTEPAAAAPLAAAPRAPAVRANPPPAAPTAPRMNDEPPELAAPTSSPCPGLLARQYIGRPLDAAERELMNTQCR